MEKKNTDPIMDGFDLQGEISKRDLITEIFPETLLSVNDPISMLIEQWDRLPVQDDFKKRVAAEEIQLAKELEAYTEDKGLIYAFVTIPFDVRNDLLHAMWKKLFLLERQGIRLDSYGTEFLLGAEDLTGLDLNLMEEEYKKCDLLYNYLFLRRRRRLGIG